MNRDEFARRWPEIRRRVKEHLKRLTDEDLDNVEGSSELLIGLIEEKYGEDRRAIEIELQHMLTGSAV
jgi:uncharacterized protein YjbJ (UPF0337 family)